MGLPEYRSESSSIESRHNIEIAQAVVAVTEDLLMVLLCYLNCQALVGVVEESMHHFGRSFGNGEVIGRPCLKQ